MTRFAALIRLWKYGPFRNRGQLTRIAGPDSDASGFVRERKSHAQPLRARWSTKRNPQMLRRVDAIVILDVAGRLSLEEGVATLREQVRQQLAAGERKILVDLSSCDYIDSAGLGELATTLIRLQNAGGRFALLGATKRVRDLLRISKLLGVFEIFDDEAHAQAAMK